MIHVHEMLSLFVLNFILFIHITESGVSYSYPIPMVLNMKNEYYWDMHEGVRCIWDGEIYMTNNFFNFTSFQQPNSDRNQLKLQSH